jgi:preprotein translocase SecE subunit
MTQIKSNMNYIISAMVLVLSLFFIETYTNEIGIYSPILFICALSISVFISRDKVVPFSLDVCKEFLKIHFPSKGEVLSGLGFTIAFCLVFGAIIACLDYIFFNSYAWIITH